MSASESEGEGIGRNGNGGIVQAWLRGAGTATRDMGAYVRACIETERRGRRGDARLDAVWAGQERQDAKGPTGTVMEGNGRIGSDRTVLFGRRSERIGRERQDRHR